jgi:WD40 repeat protein
MSFCIRTGSDDNALVFLHGTPYKFNKVIRTHSSFVHTLHYSASGSHFVSGGADRKLFLYDGSSGDVLTADGLEGHVGSVFAVSFNPDGTSLASSSADQSVRTWDVETSQQTAKWSFHQQQVGGTHLGEQVISVSLNGDINVIDKRQPEKAAQTLYVSFTLSSNVILQTDVFFKGRKRENSGKEYSF